MRSEEVIGSSLGPPQYFRSLEVVGGPPYSPEAMPVDHFIGFLFGSMIFVCSLIGFFADGIRGSWYIGAAAEMQLRIAIFWWLSFSDMILLETSVKEGGGAERKKRKGKCVGD